jgi:riboflavin biosynthesis pyrimidine reductase
MGEDATVADIRQIWPVGGADPLDEAGLVAAYAWPADRPTVRLNFVTSIDGAVTVDGRSAGLGSTGDRRVFDLLRMTCDAVVVGAGTLRAEGYGPMRLAGPAGAWRRDRGRVPDPVLVAVSRSLDLDPAHPMFVDAPVRPIVITSAGAPIDRRTALSRVADLLVHGEGEVDLPAAVTALTALGHRNLLCEGGPHLLGTLTGADLADEMCLTVSPALAGPGAGRITAGPVTAVRDMALAGVLVSDDVLLLRYARRR